MSLYNRLFGENQDATALLGMIGVTRNDFQRYRDVYLNTNGDTIIVLTRLGGGNRKEYKQVFKNMENNNNYIKNYDDKFDNTYCYFEFKVPEKYLETCKKIAPKNEELSVGEKFEKEIKDSKIPGSDASKRMIELAAEIASNLEHGNTFIGL